MSKNYWPRGQKLKPFIVFGGAKREVEALNKEFRSHCVIVSSSNDWMNEEHMTRYVEKLLKDNKMDSVIIPIGCTKYLQAPDVS